MFLRAIGIYKPTTHTAKLFKPPIFYKNVYSVGTQFDEFNKKTLPQLSQQIAPIEYFISDTEYHYIKSYPRYLIVLISKNFIEPEYLSYLFFNIHEIYSNPTHVNGLKLQQILDNPLAYSKKFIPIEDKKLEELKKQLDELKLELFNVQDKLIARAEVLELLVNRTSNLQQEAFKFHKNTKEPNQCACWSYVPRFG